MGVFANRTWVKISAWAIAAVIVALNLKLVFDELSGWLGSSPAWLWVLVMIPLTLAIEENDLPVEYQLLHGHPAEAIVGAVEEAGIDMLDGVARAPRVGRSGLRADRIGGAARH